MHLFYGFTICYMFFSNVPTTKLDYFVFHLLRQMTHIRKNSFLLMNSDKSHEVDKVVLHPICHKQVGEVKT